MEHYIVSARKYRPSTFKTVIGQKALTAALKHAVATDRLAHAYLFCGSRGVGKTSCARIFAKTINCQNRGEDGEACNQCASCQAFNNGTSLNIIELDAASHNGIDDIKSLTEQVMVPPREGKYRVFIIDEVHMLSASAFNAFLKTLEEPPEYVIFILATTEKHKIIPTILSRCQIYDFNRITIQDMVDHMSYVASNEGIAVDSAALNVIARKADGAMRDALSIFDQVAASTLGNVTYQNTIANLNILDNTYYSRLVEAFLRSDVPTALMIYKEVREKGFDSLFFINGLALYLRDLMVAMSPSTISLLEASDDVRQQMAAIASQCSPKFLYAAMSLCNDADLNFRLATNKQFLIELTLVKLCKLCEPTSVQPHSVEPLKPINPVQPTSQPQAPRTAPQNVPPASTSNYGTTQQPSSQASATAAQAPSQHFNQQTMPSQQSQSTAKQPIANQTPQSTQQAQQPPAPAYTPQAPHRPSAKRAPGAPPSISILGKKEEKPSGEQATSGTIVEKRVSPYTPDQLMAVWNEFIDAHPTEHILINTMRAAPPRKTDGDMHLVEVDDVIQVEELVKNKPEILAMMHQKLQNDMIDFTVKVKEGAAAPVAWTQREVLQHMIEVNAPLTELIKDLSLSL